MWEYQGQNPVAGSRFAHMMAAYAMGRPQWMDPKAYPISERLIDGADEGDKAVFLVDVASGTGHDMKSLKSRFPSLPGRLIMQDLPHIISQVNPTPGIETMVHDFNNPQPIRGKTAL